MGGYLSNLYPKKTKGFTLIELLAVIVVLAIIALIAVPIVLNIIEKAREGAAVSSARSYIRVVESYLVLSELDENKEDLKNNNKYNVTTSTSIGEKTYEAINNLLEIKGSKPIGSDDYIILGDVSDIVEAKLTINGYEILIKNDEVVNIIKGKIIMPESISLNKTSGSLEISKTLQLEATILPENAINKKIEWTSSDEEVATVDSKGLVTGVKEGTVTISATTNNGKSVTANITITSTYLTNVVNVGDYIAYDAGTWTSSASLPTSQGQFGGYIKDQNKASSVSCDGSTLQSSVLKGWRVLKIENSQVYLTHAGEPECYYHDIDANSSVIVLNNRATSEYLNSTYAESAHMMTYDEANAINQADTLRKAGFHWWLATAYGLYDLANMSKTGYLNYGNNSSWGIRPVIVLKQGIKTSGKTTDAVGQVAWNLTLS